MDSLHSVDIWSMEIPVRATPFLVAHGCTTAAILDAMSDAEILAIPGIGRKLLADIRRAVEMVRSQIRGGSIH